MRAEKTVQRLCGKMDDRLVLIERGVEEHRYAGLALEGFDEAPVSWVRALADRLEAARPVHVRNSRHALALCFSYGIDLQHEGIGIPAQFGNQRRKMPE